uniref:Proteasome activator complex subunit 1 n=1 Tax=Cyprinus carpio TaxID=7962 RepID=A0A8C1SB04_CYPCA
FSQKITKEAEQLISNFFPEKIAEMDNILQGSCSLKDLAVIRAPLDIPIPDPAKEDIACLHPSLSGLKGPPCGPIACNETVEKLIKQIKPEIQTLKECLNTVSMWIQLQIPRIEDGNNFGVSVQEKVFELLTNTRTKIEGFQTQISKYYSERGDAVAKASKQPHVGDFRQLVHELDQHQYCELRIIVLEIRNTYAVLYDVIIKNCDKIKKPRGDLSSKALIY